MMSFEMNDRKSKSFNAALLSILFSFNSAMFMCVERRFIDLNENLECDK